MDRWLETERIFLRNFTEADADRLFVYHNDERCSRYRRYDDTSREYLAETVRTFSGCRFLSKEEEQHYGIVAKADGTLAGDLSVFYTEEDNCFTIGLTLAPEFQRCGIGYELMTALVAALNGAYPSVDVVALTETDNNGSIALLTKLGFVREGYAPPIDSFVYCKYGVKQPD